MENGPKLDRSKNGQKMGQKWTNNGKLPQKSIFCPFFGHFCPCPAWGRFPFRFPFFFHFRLLAVFHAIPARQDPKVREQKRHITGFHIKLLSVTPVTDPPDREPGQIGLYSLRSEDALWHPAGNSPPLTERVTGRKD